MPYSLTAPAPLALRCWDEEGVLYDPISGDTHLLGRMAAEVLQRIASGPADVDALVSHFCADASAEEAAALQDEMQRLLDHFEHMALITRCQP